MKSAYLYPENGMFEWLWNYVVKQGSLQYGSISNKNGIDSTYDYAYAISPAKDIDLEAHFHAAILMEEAYRVIELTKETEVGNMFWNWQEGESIRSAFHQICELLLKQWSRELLALER